MYDARVACRVSRSRGIRFQDALKFPWIIPSSAGFQVHSLDSGQLVCLGRGSLQLCNGSIHRSANVGAGCRVGYRIRFVASERNELTWVKRIGNPYRPWRPTCYWRWERDRFLLVRSISVQAPTPLECATAWGECKFNSPTARVGRVVLSRTGESTEYIKAAVVMPSGSLVFRGGKIWLGSRIETAGSAWVEGCLTRRCGWAARIADGMDVTQSIISGIGIVGTLARKLQSSDLPVLLTCTAVSQSNSLGPSNVEISVRLSLVYHTKSNSAGGGGN
jgi:hypothetical protein